MDNILQYLVNHPIEYYCLVVLFSLVVGSFLNVVIYRLPKMLHKSWEEECYEFLELEKPEHLSASEKFNLLFPSSKCPSCKHKIAAWQNIPLLSYIFLQGKCFYCKEPISFRYPAVEVLTAALSFFVAWKFGVTLLTLSGLLLTWCLLAQTFIDIEHMIVPDEITMPFLWLGLIVAYFGFGFVNLQDALLGAVAGYLTLFLIYEVFRLITKKEGVGFGDFKLYAMIGAWIGWQMLPQVLFIAATVGTIFGLSGILFKNKQKDTPIPFGPYLALAAWVAMIWGNEINNWYLRFSGIIQQ